jgi:hypothetical protein
LQEDSLAMLEGFEVSLAGIVSSLILVRPDQIGTPRNPENFRDKPLKHNACLLSITYRKISDVAQLNSAYRWIWY